MDQEYVAVEVVGVYQNKTEGLPPYLAMLSDNADRRLAIYMGECEVYALSYALKGEVFERPLTHELILSCIEQTGAVLENVCVNSIQNGIYVAAINLRIGKQKRELDARPSDAMAVALRAKCPIYVSEIVLQEYLQIYPPHSPETWPPPPKPPSV